MIEDTEKKGILQRDSVVIESTSRNKGIGLLQFVKQKDTNVF